MIEYIVQDPRFKLVDVNPNSSMFEQEILLEFANASPEKVSAWYFGHSTEVLFKPVWFFTKSWMN